MTYTMTYVRRRGGRARTMNLDMNQHAAEQVCKSFANSAHRVVLADYDDDGMPVLVARWQGGRSSRTLPEVRAPRPRVIDGEVAPAVGEALTNLRDAADAYVEATENGIAIPLTEQIANENTDADLYEGFCVKCHESREFVGEIHVSANGRRMAKGNCPVCGSGMNRILKNVPVEEQESYDTPDDEPEMAIEPEPVVDEAEPEGHALLRRTSGGRTRLWCECGEWEMTVKANSPAESRAVAEYEAHEAEADDEEFESARRTDSNDLTDEHPDTDETAPEILPTDHPDYDEAAQQEAEKTIGKELADDLSEQLRDSGIETAFDNLGVQEAAAEDGNGVSSPTFSDAPAKKATAKKAAPTPTNPMRAGGPAKKATKRAPRKQATSDSDAQAADAELAEVTKMRVAECPHCFNNVPVKEVPSARIAYLMVHADATHHKPECLGSRSSVEFTG